MMGHDRKKGTNFPHKVEVMVDEPTILLLRKLQSSLRHKSLGATVRFIIHLGLREILEENPGADKDCAV